MKILFVTDLYPIGNEKIAKALFYFVREWQKQGHSVDVIRANYILNTIIRGRKIIPEKIYFENSTKIYNLNFHTPFWFNVYDKLPEDFSLKNYDVLISHMPCGALTAQKLLKKEKIKYVCAVHASDITVLTDWKYSLYFKNQLRKAYINADKIAVRSPVLKRKIEEIIHCAKEKDFIAFSGLDEETFSSACGYSGNKKELNPKDITITTISTLIKRKNIDIIIKTLSLLKEYNIKLKIIGSGKEEKSLKDLASNLNLNEKITFTGELNHARVMEELNKSDIFVLLSVHETFGLAYLEAMAANNIIIAKKDDGIDGILINEKNSFLINSDEYELKDCILQILSSDKKDIDLIRQNACNTINKLTSAEAAKNYSENI